MDWRQIKNIFIITFLILDLYLIYELVQVLQLSEVDVKAEMESSIEMRLKADEIEYESLPKGYVQDYYLKAKPKTFTEEDTEKSVLSDQVVTIIDETMLQSILKEPFKVTEKSGPDELNQYMKEHVLYGDQYQFWKRSSDGTTVTYTQQYNNKKFFENDHAQLTFYINSDSEVYYYTQTYLEEIKELSDPEKIIQPIKALDALWTKREIPPKSKITNVEFGYYTLVPLLSDTQQQVLNPAWCFEVEGKGKLYVSAFEGEVVTDLKATTQKKVME